MDVGARDWLVHCVETLDFQTLDFFNWLFASHTHVGRELSSLLSCFKRSLAPEVKCDIDNV